MQYNVNDIQPLKKILEFCKKISFLNSDEFKKLTVAIVNMLSKIGDHGDYIKLTIKILEFCKMVNFRHEDTESKEIIKVMMAAYNKTNNINLMIETLEYFQTKLDFSNNIDEFKKLAEVITMTLGDIVDMRLKNKILEFCKIKIDFSNNSDEFKKLAEVILGMLERTFDTQFKKKILEFFKDNDFLLNIEQLNILTKEILSVLPHFLRDEPFNTQIREFLTNIVIRVVNTDTDAIELKIEMLKYCNRIYSNFSYNKFKVIRQAILKEFISTNNITLKINIIEFCKHINFPLSPDELKDLID